ncbi:hypothetical protein [Treponema sp.]|uniref:tetratricopeptide repeat protein n=1 Tax=Treponema sp. TaxID=166 RepID=UPI0025E0C1A8|nr:hypothetical protein [Treponema sp.]MCR5218299.1 hypothetical protein [Treponema sp.]
MKKFLTVLAVMTALFSAGLFAEKTPYSSADKATQKLLKKTNKLIQKEQYESAFASLSEIENEYTIAKSIEICTNYFAVSMMHTMFGFKNLEKGETLLDVRRGDGTYNYTVYNPAEVVKAYVEEHGEKPILDYALGLYYDDVLARYSGNWIMSDEEIAAKSLEHLSKAYDQKCYDGYSLSVLGLIYCTRNEYEKADSVYARKDDEGFDFTADDYYNYAIILTNLDQLEKALKYAEKSIKGYSDNPEYQIESYTLSADIALYLNDFKKAKSLIKKCQDKYPEHYRPLFSWIKYYVYQNDVENVLKKTAELYAIEPENPKLLQSILGQFFDLGTPNYLTPFFENALNEYKDNLSAKQNLLIHYAYLLKVLGNKEAAKEKVELAREELKKDDSLSPGIEEFLNSIITEE